MNLEETRATDSVLLAVLGTELANRRTLPAYLEAVITLLAAGFAILRFLNEGTLLRILGVSLVAGSGVVLVLGAVYYRQTKREIDVEREECGLRPSRSSRRSDQER